MCKTQNKPKSPLLRQKKYIGKPSDTSDEEYNMIINKLIIPIRKIEKLESIE